MRPHATPTRLFLAGFLLLQLAWIITVPPFAGIDEFDHAYRAAAVAGGDWVADQAPADGRGLLVAVPPDIVEAAHAQCAELTYTGPDNCNPAGEASGGRVLVASGAATYHPEFYWIVGTVAKPFEGATALYVMRAVSALLCAVFVGLAAWSCTRGGSAWSLAGLALALTPVLVYSTTVVAPNGLEMAAGVALWTSLLRLRVEPDPDVGRRLLLVAILSAATVCSLRFLGPLWVVLAVGTVAAFDLAGTLQAVRQHARLVVAGTAVVGVALAGFAAWMLLPEKVSVPDDRGIEETLSPLHLVLWIVQSIAAFPYRNQLGPGIVYAVVGTLVITLVAVGVRLSTGRRRAVLVASLLAAIFIPMVATLLTYGGGEIIWQGRYGLPFGVGFVLIAATIVAERGERVPRVVIGLAVAAYAVAVIACLLKVRSRELGEPASVADPAWHTPWPLVLVLLVVVALAAQLVAVLRQEADRVRALPAERQAAVQSEPQSQPQSEPLRSESP